MSRDGRPLPEGWDAPIPDSVWPQAMISAIRHDASALASPRVIRSIRAWQNDALQTADRRAQREGLRMLKAIGQALLHADEELPATMFGSGDDREETGPVDTQQTFDTDSGVEAIEAPAAAPAPASRAPSQRPRSVLRAAETDKPRRGVKQGDLRSSARPLLPPEGPTSASEELFEAARAVRNAHHELDDVADARDAASEATIDTPSIVAVYQLAAPPPPEDFAEGSERPTTSMPMPERRRAPSAAPPPPPSVRKKEEPRRPRAAMMQVRALYSAVIAFCRELEPLGYERRSRRFWAHWREVSGDRGVRREFIENLLRTAATSREMVSELIAEVQSVDAESVRQLIDRVEAEGHPSSNPPPPAAREAAGALAGTSIRVEGADEIEP